MIREMFLIGKLGVVTILPYSWQLEWNIYSLFSKLFYTEDTRVFTIQNLEPKDWGFENKNPRRWREFQKTKQIINKNLVTK